MPKDGEIDGFTAFRAAQKANAAPGGEGPRVRAAAEGRTKRGQAPGSRIGRTAMPSGKAIVCYYCDHEFEIVGAQANTMCPGCKEWLDVKDITVNRANWSQDITTAGSLVINSMGVVTGGTVLANKVILKGKIEGGEIYATHQLIVHKNALLNLDNVTARDLVIEKGAEFEVEEGLLDRFHNIEVHGALAGTVRPTGKFIIHPSGYFTGMIEAGAIQVLDGGILEASCKMTGQIREPAIRSKPSVPKRSKTSNTPAAKAAMATRATRSKSIAPDEPKTTEKKASASSATPPSKPATPSAATAGKTKPPKAAKAAKPSTKKAPTSAETSRQPKQAEAKPTAAKPTATKPTATPAKAEPTAAPKAKPKRKKGPVVKADPLAQKPKPKPKELVVKKPKPKPGPTAAAATAKEAAAKRAATLAAKRTKAVKPSSSTSAKKKTVAKTPTKPTKPTKPSSSTGAKKKTTAKKPSSSTGAKKKTTVKKPSPSKPEKKQQPDNK